MPFEILILGSGAATPTFNRNCSAQYLTICGTQVLIDCGESTQNQIRKYHKKFQTIKAIFISHLHGDHFFGLPGLISTMHLCGRTEPLTVYAPKGAREALMLLFEVSGTELRFELTINEIDTIEPVEIHRDKNFRVVAFPLHHSLPTYGFVFEEFTPLLNLRPNVREQYGMSNDECVRVKQGEDLVLADGTVVPNVELTFPPVKPRRYAYCCDTAYDESIIPVVAGVDLLCMESTFGRAFEQLAKDRCHCTAAQAASIALQAGAGKLILTHFSARFIDTTPLLAEARSVFANTECAADGALFKIENQQEQL